ncbi:hypothetical protein [Sporolactobacillus terrae]|uniref:hypothetical protein n=1 Tax=Sporolactobacillus terrae TaxID=269673 RepID=UPI00048BBE02|nr:hypothetical protein [Sporolactobacillus terrae]
MSKFVERELTNTKGILKFPDHYVAISVTVDDAGITTNADGKKIVPAGTILGGGFIGNSTNKAKKAVTAGDPAASDAEGVLLTDVDVTYGAASGAAVIHGFIDTTKLPAAPTAEEAAALKQITFIA